MELYHFIGEKYGLEAIEKQRLKASSLNNLNDPFELFAIDLSSSREFRDALNAYKSYLGHKHCLLCFSKAWRSPVLWSHYADRHKGMALVFEVEDAQVAHVKYRKQRIKINEARLENEDTTKHLLTTKYIEWSHEQEARVFTPLEDVVHDGGLLFVPFNGTLALKSVILGALATTEDSKIKEKLPPGVTINVIRSRMAFKSFDIVRNKLRSIRKLKGVEQCAKSDHSTSPRAVSRRLSANVSCKAK